MGDTIDVQLRLTRDKPNSMNFQDTYASLGDIWYRFDADAKGNVTLRANADGFEQLARFFLKMARSGKNLGYHIHRGLEFGIRDQGPELTVILVEAPESSPSPDR